MNYAPRTLRSPSIPPQVQSPPIAHGWYAEVEDYQGNARVGQRFLVRRQYQSYRDRVMIVDFITVRREYNSWEHVTALYLENEPTPFGVHCHGAPPAFVPQTPL